MHHVYFYWKGKGVPYLPDSLRSIIMAKYFGTMDFATPAVFLLDPELIKDVLVKDFENFHDHHSFLDEDLDPLFKMRNTLSPSFTASNMKIMFDLVSKYSREFVDYLVDQPELYVAIETKQIFRRYITDFYVRGIEISKAFSGFLTLFKFMFMHLLMQARDKNDSNVHKMTLDDIISQVFIFFLVGFETLMCFVAHELAVNPDIQDRLRDEVQQHLAEDNEISYELLSKMTYMDMVISETLRKYHCRSIIVEPGNVVMISVYGLHHDSKYFPDPNKFDPERFSEKNKDNIVPYTYLPFGHRPKKCIGNRFALMETKILIAHLLQKFILKRIKKLLSLLFSVRQNSI
ncbi:hypothetical protein ACFW04_011670 [Cataglyphis niger]